MLAVAFAADEEDITIKFQNLFISFLTLSSL